jgi:hypothetical protein
VIDRRHFNRLLRFADAVGAIEYLQAAIAAAIGDYDPAVEHEIYPYERYGLEIVRYVGVKRGTGVIPTDSFVLRLDPGAFTITSNPWKTP